MKPSPSPETRVRYQFERFCKKVIQGERCDYLRELQRRTSQELTFSELPPAILEKIHATGANPADQYTFRVFGYLIPIHDDHLAESLLDFGVEGSTILLLAYSLSFSDQEIAALLGVSRSKVQRDRQRLLAELKRRMHEE